MKYFLAIVLVIIGNYTIYAQNLSTTLQPIVISKETDQDINTLLSASAVVLNEDVNVFFQISEEGGYEIIQHVKKTIKINKEEGADKAYLILPYVSNNYFQEMVEIEFYKIFRTNNTKEEVIEIKKANNQRLSSDYYIKEIKPTILVGDIVEYEYTKTVNAIDEIPIWYFQDDIPKLKSYYTVRIPNDLLYLISITGYLDLNLKKTNDATRNLSSKQWMQPVYQSETVLKFSPINIPAFKREPLMENERDAISSIRFNLAQFKFPMQPLVVIPHDDQSVAIELLKKRNLGSELRNDNFWKKTLTDENFYGLSNTEKAEKILQIIQNKIKWNRQYSFLPDMGVRRAWGQSIGNSADINLALHGALKFAGIEAYPIALSTRSNGTATMLFQPFINHIIIGAKIDNKWALLDATDPQSAINLLPIEDINGTGWMIIDEKKVEKVELQPQKISYKQEDFILKLEENGDATGELKLKMTFYEAYLFKKRYLENAIERHKLEIEKREKSFFLKNGLENTTQPNEIDVVYPFQKYNFAKVNPSKKTITFNTMQFYRDKRNPFTSDDRMSNIDFIYPFMDIYKMIVEIPEGYKVASMPKNQTLLNNQLGLRMTYEVVELKNNTWQIGFVLRVTKPKISRNDYSSLKAFYEAMELKLVETIELIKEE